jgi:predicted transposase YbfD/YdcC
VLSAFAVDSALVLAHIDIDEKSNEIPAVQKLLEELDVAGHIITCDAMHCQKNLRSRGRSERASDRSTQRQSAYLASESRGCLQHGHASFRCSDRRRDGKKRNRHETRTIAVFDATPAVAGTEWEPYVAAVVQVERTVHAFQPATGLWKTSAETSFYLSNRPIDANHAADAIPQALADREQAPLHA